MSNRRDQHPHLASRLAPAFVALGARARIIGPTTADEQFVPVEKLYRTPTRDGQRETTLRPDQVLTHVLLPPVDGLSGAYEVRHGENADDPLAAAAAVLHVVGGIVRDAQIVLGQVATTPWISTDAARAIIGQRVNLQTATAAGRAAVAPALPLSHNEYKVQLAETAVTRAILSAAGQETGGF